MDNRLRELLDHHDIRQTLASYCHGCDRMDVVEMAGTYCEESWDDHGPSKMPGRAFSIETVRDFLEGPGRLSHQLGQSLIRVNGQAAGAETYFIATVVYPTEDGGESLNQIGGRYVDTLRRANARWLIEKRICVREWSITQPVAQDWLAHAGFARPERGPSDPSYQALGMTHSGNPWLGSISPQEAVRS